MRAQLRAASGKGPCDVLSSSFVKPRTWKATRSLHRWQDVLGQCFLGFLWRKEHWRGTPALWLFLLYTDMHKQIAGTSSGQLIHFCFLQIPRERERYLCTPKVSPAVSPTLSIPKCRLQYLHTHSFPFFLGRVPFPSSNGRLLHAGEISSYQVHLLTHGGELSASHPGLLASNLPNRRIF